MIVLDTHVLVWLRREPRKLSRAAVSAIGRAGNSNALAVSAITVVELAGLLNSGRLRGPASIPATLSQLVEDVEVLPVTLAIAIQSAALPSEFPLDPLDRIIAATAQVNGVALVTADERILNCASIKTIW
jgi:PIN domain nuclease of toxin-antitoxin system